MVEMTTRSSCPLCGSVRCFPYRRSAPLPEGAEAVELGLADAGSVTVLLACPDCGLLFREDVPSPAALRKHYQEFLPALEPVLRRKLGVSDEQVVENNRRRFTQLFERVSKLSGRASGRIVDVGGGNGASLVPWARAGWKTTLIDPGAKTRVRSSEIHEAFGTVQDAQASGIPPADVLTSYHCLEHVADLAVYLREMRVLSRPGTVWVVELPVELPYIRGISKRVGFKAEDIHPQHLNFFTRRSLRSLANHAGLEVIKIQERIVLHWFGDISAYRIFAKQGAQTVKLPRPFPGELAMRGALRLETWMSRKKLAGERHALNLWRRGIAVTR